VRMLALTHLSTRYAGGDRSKIGQQGEARAVFPSTEVPRDFDTVEIPFPERGPARLIRWSNRPAPVDAGRGAGRVGGGGERGPSRMPDSGEPGEPESRRESGAERESGHESGNEEGEASREAGGGASVCAPQDIKAVASSIIK
jgi:hypothetical protein